MRFCGDYHMHTRSSDGHASVEGCVRAAKERGLKEIAISDHSFATFMYHMTEKKFAKQSAEISALSGCGVKILQGIEGNLIGNKLDVPHSVIRKCDVLTVGFHRFISPSKQDGQNKFLRVNGFAGKGKREKLAYLNTEAYLSVMENYPIDIIAHLGHRAIVDFAKVCECAARHNVYIELNAKHLDTLKDGIADAIGAGLNFIVGSDAHSADKIGKFEEIEKFIKDNKIPMNRVFGIDGNTPVFKDKKEWKYGGDV